MGKGDVVIIANPKGKGYSFAKSVYDYVIRKNERNFPVIMNHMEKTFFDDSEFKMQITENIRGAECFYIQDSNSPPAEWLTELLFGLEAMAFSSPAQKTFVTPYMRFARQDRKNESRVSVNSKVVADTISHYADRGMVADLHTPQIQEYFDIPVDNFYSMPYLVNHLTKNHPDFLKNLLIVSPDPGGGKRAEDLRKRLAKRGIETDLAICYKQRQRDNEVEQVTITADAKKRNCLIIDDIIDTGGTLIKTSEELRKRNAKLIYAYAPHGLFSKGTKKFSALDKLMISDTIYQPPSRKFEVISLTDLFGEAIYRTVTGQSMSNLFDS